MHVRDDMDRRPPRLDRPADLAASATPIGARRRQPLWFLLVQGRGLPGLELRRKPGRGTVLTVHGVGHRLGVTR